jgi:hypothetical protein
MEPTESMPIIITPPPPPSPLPTPREWPAAIEVTPPPTSTDSANTLVEYGPDPTAFMVAAMMLTVLVGNLVLAGRNGRKR